MSGPRQVAFGPQRIVVDDDQPTFWDRVEAGGWEPGTLRILDRRLGPKTRFLDIGAWVGPLTLHAAALGAEVVALEADPAALDQLRRNLAANPDLAGRVTLVPKALAASPGPVRMGARRKPGDSMSSVLLADSQSNWIAPATTAGELASDARPFDLIKLDIEGGEYAILPTLQPLLDATPALLLALHPDILAASGDPNPEGTSRDALAILRGWNAARIGDGERVPATLDEVAAAGPAEWLFSRNGSAAGCCP
jgi:FkbM family methyltransferase